MLFAVRKLESDNNRSFLDMLYRKHYSAFYSLAYSILRDDSSSQDAVSDAVLSLFSLVPKLQDMEDHELIGYLRATVRNAAYKRYNAEKRKTLTEFVPFDNVLFSLPAPVDQEPPAILLKNEEAEQVRRAISTLPEKDRQVLYLKYAARLTAKEIAEMTNAPSEEAVSTQLSRARKKVLHLLRIGGARERRKPNQRDNGRCGRCSVSRRH